MSRPWRILFAVQAVMVILILAVLMGGVSA